VVPAEQTFDVGELTLAVRVWAGPESDQPPLVLLPATGKTADDWDMFAGPMSASRTVFAVNLRGHGASAWPGTYSIELMTDDVVAWLGACFPDGKVDLVGHSLGGLVACAVATRCPDQVRRLVLEDVGLLKPRPADPPAKPDQVLAFDWKVVEQVRPEIDNFAPAWADVIARIEIPTLVIAGGSTSPVPQEQIAGLVRLLPHGRMVTIEAGHLVHASKPSEFTAQVLSFLS
jgi:pimeloyl-ACP methyl ester carboxylesterase